MKRSNGRGGRLKAFRTKKAFSNLASFFWGGKNETTTSNGENKKEKGAENFKPPVEKLHLYKIGLPKEGKRREENWGGGGGGLRRKERTFCILKFATPGGSGGKGREFSGRAQKSREKGMN